jgi:hypothetical protein
MADVVILLKIEPSDLERGLRTNRYNYLTIL